MTNKNYDDIEVPQEMVDALDESESTTEIETTESPKQTTEESSQGEANDTVVEDKVEAKADTEEPTQEVEEVDSFDGLEIDGNQFTRDEILAWRDDATNKESWQKSNTEKAQKLSQWSKLADKINSDDEFRTHIKDYFFEKEGEAEKLGLDGSMEIPESEQPEVPSELEERLKVLESIEGDRVMDKRVDNLDSTLANLEKQYPDYLGDQDKVWNFLEFADKNADKFVEKGMPNLERAFKEWSYNEMQEQLNHYKKLDNNGKRNDGKIINTSEGGAKEVKSDNKVKNWEDVNMDNPEIAKFFND